MTGRGRFSLSKILAGRYRGVHRLPLLPLQRQATRVGVRSLLRVQAEHRQQELTAWGEFIGDLLDNVIDRFDEHTKRARNALMDAIEARFST